MQNKDGKKFTKNKGAMLILSLCLVGGAVFTTFYTMDRAEKMKEQQQKLIDLNEEARNEERKVMESETAKQTEVQSVNNADAKADISRANEMDVDPPSLIEVPETEANKETEAASLEAEDSAAVSSAKIQPTVAYDDSTPLTWPVAGTVLIDYSMDATVYFSTLDQYKYNPAIIIGAEVGGQVVASAKGIVEAVGIEDETGTTLTLNLGNEYKLIYGQLKEVAVEEGDIVEAGQLLGYVSEPTKYYCKEGSNLFFEVEKNGVPADPFLYLE